MELEAFVSDADYITIKLGKNLRPANIMSHKWKGEKRKTEKCGTWRFLVHKLYHLSKKFGFKKRSLNLEKREIRFEFWTLAKVQFCLRKSYFRLSF